MRSVSYTQLSGCPPNRKDTVCNAASVTGGSLTLALDLIQKKSISPKSGSGRIWGEDYGRSVRRPHPEATRPRDSLLRELRPLLEFSQSLLRGFRVLGVRR